MYEQDQVSDQQMSLVAGSKNDYDSYLVQTRMMVALFRLLLFVVRSANLPNELHVGNADFLASNDVGLSGGSSVEVLPKPMIPEPCVVLIG
jgi:hypothetical protein